MYLQETSKQQKRSSYPSNMAWQKALYWLGCVLVNQFSKTIKPDIVDRTPLPAGKKIFAANHPTTLDPFLMLSYVPEQVSILVTEDVFKIPAFGRYLRSAGHIPVFKSNGRVTFRQAIDMLESGTNIGIFPEGALSPLVPELGFGRARTGAVRLALETGAPIIPIGISLPLGNIRYYHGNDRQNPWIARYFLRGPYAVSIGAPIWLPGKVNDKEHLYCLSDELISRIAALSGASQLRLSGYRDGRIVQKINASNQSKLYGQQRV